MAIHRLETTGDLVVFLLICTAMTALGLLLLLYPSAPLPPGREAYRQVSGPLAAIHGTGRSRNRTWARFYLAGDPQLYESNLNGIDQLALRWQPEQTRLSFFIPASNSALQESYSTVYGLSIDGIAPRMLEADIALANARSTPWGGLFPLALGLLGYGVAWFAWRKRAASIPTHV